jgi:hypothetical protein
VWSWCGVAEPAIYRYKVQNWSQIVVVHLEMSQALLYLHADTASNSPRRCPARLSHRSCAQNMCTIPPDIAASCMYFQHPLTSSWRAVGNKSCVTEPHRCACGGHVHGTTTSWTACIVLNACGRWLPRAHGFHGAAVDWRCPAARGCV